MPELNNSEIVTSVIRSCYQDQSDRLVDKNQSLLVSHFGSFSQNLVATLSETVENLMVSMGDQRIVVKRMFSILIEGLQNLRIHGELDESGQQTGFLILSCDDEKYQMHLANIVLRENSEALGIYTNTINSYSAEELKEVYSSVLSNEFISIKGGAGLGLILTRIKSGNPLNFEMIDLDEEKQLFVLEITLDRR